MKDKQIEKLIKISWWNWEEQKIEENSMLLWSDDIDEFIKKHS